ncbi:hypothetical protein BN77_0801 [Rhizobium mesoamericanum STM3625]|uniref:Uncharacterized protein n=1 Tax=Rhizobium mesoamericanum STM3625 TaxID=1211777 RepID=K0PVL8_9HYPH|nr:hypothetical protein BN77_0801 [Rhizobium mesoamericanum STM3625]
MKNIGRKKFRRLYDEAKSFENLRSDGQKRMKAARQCALLEIFSSNLLLTCAKSRR